MKHFKNFLFIAIFCIGAVNFTSAQSNVAHINTKELIESMPEMTAARTELEKVAKTYEAVIQEMATELEATMKQYNAEVETKTDEENAKRAQEVQTKQQSIREYQSGAQQDLQKKEFDLLKPITEKAKRAIEKVARANGFQYVLDSSPNSGIVMAEGKDLMVDVKIELGI
jgi:outer membrane protein